MDISIYNLHFHKEIALDFQLALLLVTLIVSAVSMLPAEDRSSSQTPEPALIQPPPGFDSGFNGPNFNNSGNFGVHDPGIQTYP